MNKQLDLQTAFTELGRVLAQTEGWYEQRRTVQFWFIDIVVAVCCLGGFAALVLARRAPMPTWLGLFGVFLVFGFVVKYVKDDSGFWLDDSSAAAE